MTWLRSRRIAAILLAIAAVIGLVLANTPAEPAIAAALGFPLGWTVQGWLQDGLLSLFFLIAGIELRHEFQFGALSSPRRAAVPAIAAAGGVLVAIALYLTIAPRAQLGGWPVPTSTDVAFALGVLSLFGHERTGRLRAFVLAFAVVNDVIGLIFVTAIGGFELQRLPTIAAVVLGVALPARAGSAIVPKLEPWVNGLVLPLFAFSATFVPIVGLGAGQIWIAGAVALSLVIGQFIGISGGGWLASRFLVRDPAERLAGHELIAAGALGGIGFTVSLLLARLAFPADAQAADAATLGVLIGSVLAIVLSAIALRAGRRRSRTV